MTSHCADTEQVKKIGLKEKCFNLPVVNKYGQILALVSTQYSWLDPLAAYSRTLSSSSTSVYYHPKRHIPLIKPTNSSVTAPPMHRLQSVTGRYISLIRCQPDKRVYFSSIPPTEERHQS